jgi:Mycothiol maleylpyruvate isomerase N-terminal domain
MDIWPVIHDERKALAADLKGRSGEEWATGSLCGQWSVRDVLAHMTSTASLTDWSHGTGPEVSGPILSLVMAMTGRKEPIADLTGEGVATLRSRP